jgi:hypothetical protein
MESKGRQTIFCAVASCEHHGQNDYCLLECIQVSPLTGTANSPEESMCDSFERKEE